MDADIPSESLVSPPKANSAPGFSLLVRRVHLYLGLFLAPWMLMYALSTLVMSHRPWVASWYATKTPNMVLERELGYSRPFPAGMTLAQKAEVILRDVGIEGRYVVPKVKDGDPIVINRQHALFLRRGTYDPKANKMTIQREEFWGLTFLERLHRRRGFQDPYAVEDTWAFSVDLTVLTMVFWAFSGVWLWWELKPTRLWGALCLGFGAVLFATFLALI